MSAPTLPDATRPDLRAVAPATDRVPTVEFLPEFPSPRHVARPVAAPGAASVPATPPGAGPGPTTAAETPRLGRRALRREQDVTLMAPRRRYSLVAKMLFMTMDLLYGRRRTMEKFQVLEIVARIPYQIWENAAYRALTRRHRDIGVAHRIRERIEENREQQDNEQWHLLITAELVGQTGRKLNAFRYRFLPWMMAVGYYHVSWLLFVLAPRWSYRLNADFEDHAEHEYAEFVAENPAFEHRRHGSVFAEQYGAQESLADLLRQIGHDERMHKQESERYLREDRIG